MKKQKIAFDIDGTLITFESKPNYKVIDLYRWFQSNGWDMYIHSGGGVDYAKMWADKLGLEPCKIAVKGDKTIEYDIAVDDSLGEKEWTEKKYDRYVNAKVYIIV